MKEAMWILALIGGIFVAVGTTVGGVFLGIGGFEFFGAFLLIPFLFIILGLCMLTGVVVYKVKKKQILKKGTRYHAKVYGYVEDTSVVVNGAYPINTKVHYFDENHQEKEAIIPTGFAKGSKQYPIGSTVDIFELNGKFSWDASSVRNEHIFREEELMDNKPLEPEKRKMVAVACNHCGSSFEAVKGYTERCPYCGNYINAD